MRAWWLLALSYLALYSHLLLDFLNNYGVRVLAPARLAVVLRRRRVHHRPVALAGARRRRVGGAPAARAAAGPDRARRGRGLRGRDARVGRDRAAGRGPRLAGPARLRAVGADGRSRARVAVLARGHHRRRFDHYETGIYHFWSPRLRLDAARIPKNEHAPEVAAARAAPAIRGFLVWSRFPFWEVQRHTDAGTVVTVQDVRFRVRWWHDSRRRRLCRNRRDRAEVEPE